MQENLRQGRESLKAKRYEDAEKEFKKANKAAHDKCADCLMGIAQSQEGMGNLEGAVGAAAKAIAAANDDTTLALAHALRGDFLIESAREGKKWNAKKVEQGRGEYKTAIDLAPQDASYHLRMALALFKEMRDTEGKAEVGRYLELSPNGQNAEFARQLRVNPRRGRDDFAPDFTVTTLKGETFQLSNLTGRFVVLDFWATWCPPCRNSVGELRDLSKKYPPDHLAILSISGDSEEGKWREFVAAKKMDWYQYRDADRRIGKLFGVRGIPCYVVIDSEGFIRERIVGQNPQESIVHRLKETLSTAVGEPVMPAHD